MGRRRRAREDTLRILFRLEFNDQDVEEVVARYWKERKAEKEVREYSNWLTRGIVSRKKKMDSIIQSASEHWRLSRMTLIDRNVLRMALFELLFEENIAPAIIINEAIEIAKKYSGEEAAPFINGILDAVRKNLEQVRKSLKEENDNGRKKERTKK